MVVSKPVCAFRLTLRGVVVSLVALCGVVSSAAADIYRWKDENDKWHYEDRVPPEAAPLAHDNFKPSIPHSERTPGKRTPEQQDHFNRLKQLRIQQSKLVGKQRNDDQSLLHNYQAEKDIEHALQVQLQGIDTTIRQTQSNLSRQQEILGGQEHRAAEQEKRGQSVTATLREQIEATRRQIELYKATIREQEAKKISTLKDFEQKLNRFRALKSLSQDPPLKKLQDNDQMSPPKESEVISTIYCQPGPQCEQAWTLAKDYVQMKTGKSLVTETDKILQTPNPTETTYSLLVTRISHQGKNGEDIVFLDARCHPSSLGDELCASSQMNSLRIEFISFIEKRLNPSP